MAAPTREAIERLRGMTVDLSDCAGIPERDPAPKSGHYCQ